MHDCGVNSFIPAIFKCLVVDSVLYVQWEFRRHHESRHHEWHFVLFKLPENYSELSHLHVVVATLKIVSTFWKILGSAGIFGRYHKPDVMTASLVNVIATKVTCDCRNEIEATLMQTNC